MMKDKKALLNLIDEYFYRIFYNPNKNLKRLKKDLEDMREIEAHVYSRTKALRLRVNQIEKEVQNR